eukprot:2658339-Pleurochrysis_carterae.AAC.1
MASSLFCVALFYETCSVDRRLMFAPRVSPPSTIARIAGGDQQRPFNVGLPRRRVRHRCV